MIIAFPTMTDNGIESPVFGHFGSANYFVFLDTMSGKVDVKENPDRDHEHGNCNPLSALGGEKVDAVVAGGIGKGALKKLQTSGVKVFRAAKGTVRYNAELITTNDLVEFSPSQTCGHHIRIKTGMDSGGCSH